MVVFLKGNTLRLTCNLSVEDFNKLAHLHNMGEVHVRLSVSYGERVGYISIDELDLSRSPTSEEQLDLGL